MLCCRVMLSPYLTHSRTLVAGMSLFLVLSLSLLVLSLLVFPSAVSLVFFDRFSRSASPNRLSSLVAYPHCAPCTLRHLRLRRCFSLVVSDISPNASLLVLPVRLMYTCIDVTGAAAAAAAPSAVGRRQSFTLQGRHRVDFNVAAALSARRRGASFMISFRFSS